MASRLPLAQKPRTNLSQPLNGPQRHDTLAEKGVARTSAILMRRAKTMCAPEPIPQAQETYKVFQDRSKQNLAVLEMNQAETLKEYPLRNTDRWAPELQEPSEEPSAISFASEMGSREHSFSLHEDLRKETRRDLTIASRSPCVPMSARSGSNAVSSSQSRTQPASARQTLSTAKSSGELYDLKPMHRGAVHPEELTGPEVLAVLRMRHVIQSFGNTEEYKLPPTKCHRMALSVDERSQIQLLRKQLARSRSSKGRGGRFRSREMEVSGPQKIRPPPIMH